MELAQSLQAASGVTGPTLKDLYLQESYQMNILMGYLYNQQELFEKIINHLNKISTSLEEYRTESKDERMYARRSEKVREKWLAEIEGSMKRFESKISESIYKNQPTHADPPAITSRIDPYKVVIQSRKIINSQPETSARVRRIESVPYNSMTASHHVSAAGANVFEEVDWLIEKN